MGVKDPRLLRKEGPVKKYLVLLLLIIFIGGIILASTDLLLAKDKAGSGKATATEPKKAEKEKPSETSTAPEPKVVCKFKNDDEMKEFEQLYIAKQATFGRMGVLQAYFSMEQNNLAEIDKKMEEKFGFKMDPTKMYDLNRDTREIRELGPIESQPQTQTE